MSIFYFGNCLENIHYFFTWPDKDWEDNFLHELAEKSDKYKNLKKVKYIFTSSIV